MDNDQSQVKLYITIGVIILIIGSLSLVSRSMAARPGIEKIRPAIINVSPRVS